MEASTLRWILIIVGLFILGLILVFGNPGKKKKPRASRKDKASQSGQSPRSNRKGEKIRKEPTLGPGSDEVEGENRNGDGSYEPGDQGELKIESDKPPREPKVPTCS